MSKQITVNGKIFEPSALLAKRFGYSLDYVSRLAREGKVDATRVGRQWFVEALSLKHFVDEVNLKKDQSREQLRAERKRELNAHQSVAPQPHASHADASAVLTGLDRSLSHSTQSRPAQVALAVLGSLLVVVAGMLAGVAMNPSDFLSLTHNKGFGFLTTNVEQHSVAGAFASWVNREPESSTGVVSSVEPVDPKTHNIVVFDETVSDQQIEDVRAAFSDEVDVVFDAKDSGVITPVFRERDGEAYRFLMVPVRDSS